MKKRCLSVTRSFLVARWIISGNRVYDVIFINNRFGNHNVSVHTTTLLLPLSSTEHIEDQQNSLFKPLALTLCGAEHID